MVKIFGKPRELSELNVTKLIRPHNRSQIPILIIDDEGFKYKDILLQHDFNIRIENDITDIKAVKEYAIVVCDIKGIGKKFKSKYEGAHIIQEINKKYPEKPLIAFSAYEFNTSYNKYFRLCDNVIKKDIDSDKWVNCLDDAIEKALNPIKQWHRIRSYLLSNDVPLHIIFMLEQEYIEAVTQRNPTIFPKSKTIEAISDDIKTVLLGFTSSVLFVALQRKVDRFKV